MRLLKLGSKGLDVRALEEKLKARGDLKGPVNEKFDARTAAAVVKFKKEHGWENARPQVGGLMAAELKMPGTGPRRTPATLRGATYNCEIHRNPDVVAKAVARFARNGKDKPLDFIQLQEISGYHDVLKTIPGYKLVTFKGSKDHGETGVLVRSDLETKFPRSIEAKTGWTNDEGGVAQPRAATSVRIAGWLRVASIHAPPGIDWVNGRPVGGDARVKSYQSLTRELLKDARRNPDIALLCGGDWNEGARTGGPGSPSWLAEQAGMKKHRNGRIDWEMSRGCNVRNVKTGADGGSDHRIVTFTVSRPGSKAAS